MSQSPAISPVQDRAARYLPRRERKVWGRAPDNAGNSGRGKRRTVRLWVPMALIWLLLAPFGLIALPFLVLASARYGVAPAAALWRAGAVLAALSGTEVTVQSGGADVRIKLV